MADTIAPLSSVPVSADTDAVAQVKTNPKGGISPVGNVPLSEKDTAELLARMEELVKERQSPLNLLMSGLKDAAAWGVPNLEGQKSAALKARDEQKISEAKDLFNMRSEMAALRSAQGQQELLKKQYEGVVGAQGAPGAAGAPAGVAAIPGLTPAQTNTILSSPNVQAELSTLAPNDYAGRLAVIRKAAQTEFGSESKSRYGAPENTPQEVPIPELGTGLDLTTNEFRAYEATGKLPTRYSQYQDKVYAARGTGKPAAATTVSPEAITKNPILRSIAGGESGFKNVPNAEGASTAYGPYQIVKGTFDSIKTNHPEFANVTWDQFKANPKIQTAMAEAYYNDNDAVLKRNNIPVNADTHHAMWFSGNTKLATLPDNTPIEKALTADQIAANKLEGKTVGDVRNGLRTRREQAAVSTAPAELAPTTKADVTTAAPVTGEPVTKSSLLKKRELEKKTAEIPIEAAATEARTAAEASGKSLEQLRTENDRANSTIAAAQRVINLADDPKLNKVMGYMHGNSPQATALATVPKFAASLVGQGENFEDLVKANVFSKDELAAHQRLNTDATQLGIEYTANMFKGARLGIGLEKLGLKGKGVSADYLPEVNKLYANLAKDAAEFELKKNKAFSEWKGNDPMKTYSQFLDTPGYDEMRNKQRELLLSRYPGVVKAETPEDGQKTTKSGVKYKVVKKDES
jgi:hypothetical protein